MRYSLQTVCILRWREKAQWKFFDHKIFNVTNFRGKLDSVLLKKCFFFFNIFTQMKFL